MVPWPWDIGLANSFINNMHVTEISQINMAMRMLLVPEDGKTFFLGGGGGGDIRNPASWSYVGLAP